MSTGDPTGPFPPDPNRKIPQFGDPDILPKGTITRPSRERMPFTSSGELKPSGPALPANFLKAPDIKDLPWIRRRGDEWTDAAFRQIVFTFLIGYIRARPWIRIWDVRERATSDRMSALKLPPDQYHLVIGITRNSDAKRFETTAVFPPAKRQDPEATAVLTAAGTLIDGLEAA